MKSLKKTFELLIPEKVLYDELSSIDKDLHKLNSRAYDIEERIKSYHLEDVYKVERILSDINITKNKSDEAWDFYRNGKYEKTHEFIHQINADISDIKEKLDRIEILISPTTTPPPTRIMVPFFIMIVAVVGAAIIVLVGYLVLRRR
ncbi:MAG: hypothetical protein H8D26_06375 [Methanomicrobia archaeon]|nr:hypothetical protein [Methanomicrobia archaeon]